MAEAIKVAAFVDGVFGAIGERFAPGCRARSDMCLPRWRVGSRAIGAWQKLRRLIKWRMDNRFLYFAYGSNMLTRRLRAASRAPSARVEATGFIEGHRLTFDKVSKEKSEGRSGKCDAEATGNPSDHVYGVLFSIDRAEEKALDEAEGRDKGYKKDRIHVVTTDGKRTAVTYIATEKDPSLRPYDWYKELVIAGAVEHGLPQSYVEWLRTVESQPDPNVARRTRNERLLSGI